VHLSETCEAELPHLITHVVITDATKTDVEATVAIHQALAKRDVLPGKYIVDAGYVDAELVL
jgi:transposase